MKFNKLIRNIGIGLSLLIIFAANAFGETKLLLKLNKEIWNLSGISGSLMKIGVLECKIDNKGNALKQLFAGNSKDALKANESSLEKDDLSFLKNTIKRMGKESEDIEFLNEWDSTGDFKDSAASKFVKNELGVAYYKSKEITFYSMRRRLSKTYNGKGAKRFRNVIRKHCSLNI